MAFRGLLEAHDRERFEIYGYSLAPIRADAVTDQLRRHFSTFRDISGHSFRQAADQINADGMHILIDLAGHTRFARPEIFALQPAPVQAHYLGYSSTIGGDFLQYLITDHRQIAPGMDRYFAEKLVYLPETFMATTRAAIATEPPTRAQYGLPDQGFVFGNFNAHYKFEPRLFGIWMRLLKRVPGSVMWFIGGTPTSERNLRREASARGVDPARIVFSTKVAHSMHLARQKLVDLALDTYHHGGGVTTVDALWVGVPVVTVASESPPSRNGATLLAAVGMEELIADGVDAYEAIAYRLASEPARLADLRRRLEENRHTHPLFDTTRLTRHLECAYRLMWQRWLDGLPPDAIEVPALPAEEPGVRYSASALASAGE
jgi:predicted O-linked N-acetylglucosamine transferase (SPINDLY family)